MDYTNYTRQRAAELGLDPNLAQALMLAESSGNPNAVSPVGALGLLQLMPGTAKQLGVDPRNPLQNIDGGLRYLKQNIDKFGVAGGLAAYNAGPGRVQNTADFNSLPTETRNYVPKVMNMAADIAEKKGTGPTLDIPTLMSGLQKAQAANDPDSVKEINGLLMQKYQGALAKAQSANDMEAVQEISNAMKQFGAAPGSVPNSPTASDPAAPSAPEPARGRPTMQNDPRIVNPNAPSPQNGPVPAQGVERGLGLGARSVLKGVTSIDYPVRATSDALGVLAKLAGFDKTADFLHNKTGTGGSAGGSIADLAGLPTPQTRTEKAISGATEGATGLLTGGAIQKGVQAATGAVSPILQMIAPTANTGKEAAIISGIQGGLEAAPEAAVPLLATAAAVKGGKAIAGKVDEKLTERAASKIDPTQAEIIKDLGILKAQNPKGPLNAAKLNTLGSSYVDEAVMKLEQSGLMTPELKFAVDNRDVLATRPGMLDSLRKTPEGEALFQAMSKDAALGMMTSREPALGGLFKLGRSAVDAGALDAVTGMPLPKSFREGAKSVLGPATERYQQADKWTTPRQQAAAEAVLKQQGPSGATTGIGVLQQMADDRLARDMAVGREAAAAKRSALEEATKAAQEKAAQQAAQQAEKQAIKEGGQIIKERQAAEKAAQEAAAPKAAAPSPISEANKLISEQMSKDPTFMLGLSNPHGVPRNEQQMSEFSKVLKDQMERRVTKEVEEKATSIMDKALGGDHSELSMGSPAFKTTAGALGMEPEALKGELLTLATENPKLKTAVGKLFTSGVSPTKKEFYGIQDAIAAKLGITPKNPNAGVLNVTPVSGALSDATTKKSDIANFVRGLPDDQVKAIVGREADTLGKSIASQKGYAVGKLSKIIDDVKAGKEVPAADMELIKSLGLM